LSAEKSSPPPAPQAVAKAPAERTPVASDTGESQLRLARQYLDGRVQPRNPAVASQLLWSAVEKGNSAAEMDLANLYLHGDGVARNCDQARVLLSVASGKGNPEAMQKLRELNQTGCR
jgi:TPR repeat protein